MALSVKTYGEHEDGSISIIIGTDAPLSGSQLNLVAAQDMEGINGNRVFAIPHERLRAVLRKFNRLRP